MPSSQTLYRAPMLPGNDLGNASLETQFPNGRGAPLQLALPSNNSLANHNFRVRIAGRVVTATNRTFQVQVYFGLSPTVTSNTLIFSSGFQVVNTISTSFDVWIDLRWSNGSNSITGRGEGQVANHVVGPGTLINTPLSADPNRDSNPFLQSGPTYGFTVTGQFNGPDSGNHAFIDSFDLEST